MIDDIEILKATITITLPIVCSECGQMGRSEPIRIETSYRSIENLSDKLKSIPLGTHFPVGWGKYYGNPIDILRCPDCVKSRNKTV